jgi:hypothetical protein
MPWIERYSVYIRIYLELGSATILTNTAMKRAVLKDLTLLVAGALAGLLGTLLLQHKR